MLTTRNLQLGLSALLVCAVASTSCGKKDRPPVIIPPTDAGLKDTGVPPVDSGMTTDEDSGTNPPPDSGMNPPPDSGMDPPDSGMNPPDSGMQMAECAVDTDCTAPLDRCIRIDQVQGVVACTGQNDCLCFQECEPFVDVEQSGCTRPAQACAFAGSMIIAGVCVNDMGGDVQNAACTSMFQGTNFVSDNCNGQQNFVCHGSDPLDVTGTCIRLCETSNNALCTALDPTTECVPSQAGSTIGACIPAITDLGVTCTMANECQGGLCSPELGGQCSQACGQSFACGNDGICVGGAQISPLCAHTCTFGAAGDTACAAINPNTICEQLAPPPNALDICFPRCTMDMDCGPAPATCNVGTGHCN